MKCANKADECPQMAIATIQFPWDDTPEAACEKHVILAKQTMTNLARLDELRVVPLPLEDVAGVLDTTATEVDAAPTTPRAAPAEAALELRTLTIKALELELELERARLARVASEMQLVELKLVAGRKSSQARTESSRELLDYGLKIFAEAMAAANRPAPTPATETATTPPPMPVEATEEVSEEETQLPS